jgi:hypothetical protein
MNLAQIALAQIDWSYAGAAILVWVVTTVLTWLISAKVTTAVLTKGLQSLTAQVQKMSESLERTEAKIEAETNDRLRCALASARTYATHGEVAHVVANGAAYSQQIGDELSNVHGRITELAKTTARVAGILEAREAARRDKEEPQ